MGMRPKRHRPLTLPRQQVSPHSSPVLPHPFPCIMLQCVQSPGSSSRPPWSEGLVPKDVVWAAEIVLWRRWEGSNQLITAPIILPLPPLNSSDRISVSPPRLPEPEDRTVEGL